MSEAATLADATTLAWQRPEWILLDLMLPDGNGVELLHTLKCHGLPSKVCVITGCGAAMRADVRELAPDHVFTKPLNVEGLLDVLGAGASLEHSA